MTITCPGSNAVDNAAAGTVAVTTPASLVANDVLVTCIAQPLVSGSNGVTGPTGWTKRLSINGDQISVWTIKLTGTPPTSYSWTIPQVSSIVEIAYRGIIEVPYSLGSTTGGTDLKRIETPILATFNSTGDQHAAYVSFGVWIPLATEPNNLAIYREVLPLFFRRAAITPASPAHILRHVMGADGQHVVGDGGAFNVTAAVLTGTNVGPDHYDLGRSFALDTTAQAGSQRVGIALLFPSTTAVAPPTSVLDWGWKF